jgi:hypothetical protein
VLWYPTQAKTGLEWGTQPWVGKENCRSLGWARDDKVEDRGPPLQRLPRGWTEWPPVILPVLTQTMKPRNLHPRVEINTSPRVVDHGR